MADTIDVQVHGQCDPEFAAVRDAFAENFRRRGEIGAAVAVYKDGEKVVDLWGGHKDKARTDPWREDTIVIMNSLAKSMSALCVHILLDRGLVAFDAPVADYWPEFAQAGKDKVLVRHVLSHTCGVIYCDHAYPGSIYDWDGHIRAMELQEPAWEPGTYGAYNSLNIGFLLGEIVRRVTGRTIGTFLREEVTARLGADYNIGLKPDEVARVSDLHKNPNNGFALVAADPTSPLHRTRKAVPPGFYQNDVEIRVREVPSFGGHGNARGMACIYASLAAGGRLDGVEILSPEAVERASQLVWAHDCMMTRRKMRMGYGFMHNESETVPMGSNPAAFGHTGTAGAFAWCDRDRNMSFAYCTNFQREGPGIGPRGASLAVAAGGGPAPTWLT
ncbi:serine hydrolase domain-containing protein [Aquabacter spiritensis]|uniref:CubicO group peptidase (Beta-lactamase class C family) n=1 Tax=Aquabacter spiritensis TaxID=933073 RepID=A0A4R3LLX2_9HYPH|nr:serine hydrolase domain-containing protein [Aquabacter spiritensis]TCT00606.1 CubicO group peptidase (beta-lactamase class C family) [Aquabacter spiritensis]